MSVICQDRKTMMHTMTMVVLLTNVVTADEAHRPVYVMGHMANSLSYLDAFLAQGANAIEADLSFATNGSASKFFHGEPCYSPLNCSAEEEVVRYLTYVRDTTSAYASRYHGKLLLLNIDVKTTGAAGNLRSAGSSFANNLIDHLWNGVQPEDMLNVLVSCYLPQDIDFLQSALATFFQHHTASAMLDHLGFDFLTGSLSDISKAFQQLGIKRHRWQGLELSNSALKEENYSRYLKSVTALRIFPASEANYVDKAYAYTVDDAGFVRLLLRHRFDGIITNAPPVVLSVLTNPEFSKSCRLATSKDDPWKRIV